MLKSFILTLAARRTGRDWAQAQPTTPSSTPASSRSPVPKSRRARSSCATARSSRSAPSVPCLPGAETHDVAGKTIMPGLVDTHSHIGGGSAAATARPPIQPDVRLLDSFERPPPGLQPRAGRRHHDGQRHARLRPPAERADALPQAARRRDHRRPAHHAAPTDASPAASRWPTAPTRCGRRRAPFPGTRAQVGVAGARAVRQGAGVSRQGRRGAGDDADQAAAARPRAWRRWSRCSTARAPCTSTPIATTTSSRCSGSAKEFGFTPVLQHVSEGWKVADEIAAAGVPASDHRHRCAGRQARGGGHRRSRPAACSTRPACSSASTPTTTSPTRASSSGRPGWPCAPACRATRRCTP